MSVFRHVVWAAKRDYAQARVSNSNVRYMKCGIGSAPQGMQMLIAYKAVVLTLAIVGFLSGLRWLYSQAGTFRGSDVLMAIVAFVWCTMLLLLWKYFGAGSILTSRTVHLTLCAVGLSCFSLASGGTCEILGGIIEDRYKSSLQAVIIRGAVLLIGAIAIASTAGMIRAIGFQLGAAHYVPNAALNRLLAAEGLDEFSMRRNQHASCTQFLKDVQASPASAVQYSDVVALLTVGFRNVKYGGIAEAWTRRISFVPDADPRVRSVMPVQLVYRAPDSGRCILTLGPDVLSRWVTGHDLISPISDEINRFSTMETEAHQNPSAVFAFGLASVTSFLGVSDLELTAEDCRAHKLDSVISRSTIVITLFLYGVIARSWQLRASRSTPLSNEANADSPK